MAKKYYFFILGLMFLTAACVTPEKKPSVCETNTAPSYLCEVAEKYGTTLENIGAVLIVSNALALGGGAYSPEDALKVLREIRAILDNPVSYLFFGAQVKKRLFKNPAMFTVSETYISQFNSPQIMRPFDQAILRSWIDKQIRNMEELKSWPR